MKKQKPIIYFISSNENIENQFTEKVKLSKIVNQDPLYIINLDLLQDDFKIKSLTGKNNNINYVYAENEWIPLRIQCELNEKCSNCGLKKFYKEDKNTNEECENADTKRYCILNEIKSENILTIQTDIRKLNLEKNDTLIHYLKKHLCNTVGMYFFGEPENSTKLDTYIAQIEHHYNSISSLNDNKPNSFYKAAFNRMDYGVSIVASEDRTIVYTNRARRKHFGSDIIGKKCYEVFVLQERNKICKGCPMGEDPNQTFDCGKNVKRSENHKLKNKDDRVYFISETASNLEIIDEKQSTVNINRFGLNVVRDISAKTIAFEFQRIIQKLDSYHHIVKILKFALIGGAKNELQTYYDDFIKEKNPSLKTAFFKKFIDKVSFTDPKDNTEKIINFGFGRMRYYRNHINIFDKEFTEIEDPLQGDTLQIFAAFSKNKKQDKEIKGKYIDYETAKKQIINELYYDNKDEKVKLNKVSNSKKNTFLEEIGLNKNDIWYDIKLEAKDSPLGYIAVDFKGKETNPYNIISPFDAIDTEQFKYLLLLIDFTAQAIQRAIDHKELSVTQEITEIINRDYNEYNKLYLEVSKILCEKLETLKAEIFTKKSQLFFRDFIYYSTEPVPGKNKELFKELDKDKRTNPNRYAVGQNMLGNVIKMIEDNLKSKDAQEYKKCISVQNYGSYNEFYKNKTEKQINKYNKQIEEEKVIEIFGGDNFYSLKNCIISPLHHNDKVIGAIKLTNNGKTGKLFFPVHEQRILYYVAQQLATKIGNIKMIQREKMIDNIFGHFSDLQEETENLHFNILRDWRDEIFNFDKKIKNNIILNTTKTLVNIVEADILYYYLYDENEGKFVKKERYRSTAVGLSDFQQLMIDLEITSPLDKVNKLVVNENNLEIIRGRIDDLNDKKVIVHPIFVNNHTFSFIYLEKFEGEFEEEDKKIIKTVVKQIQGVLQMAVFKRKSFEIMQNLAHQTIAPLSGLEAYIPLLQRNMKDKSDKDYYPIDDEKKSFIYRLLESQTKHLINLTKGNRYFIDIEAGNKPTLNTKTFDLTAELIRIASVFQPMAKLQGINAISVKTTNAISAKGTIEGFNIFTDKTLLSHIGFCLVDNAIKYSDKGKEINITITEDKNNHKYIIRFIDYGLNIPKPLWKKIFERNYRSSNAKKRNPHGSGIGLYLVKQFAELLDGSCSVEVSDKKNGTIIKLEIAKTLKTNKL